MFKWSERWSRVSAFALAILFVGFGIITFVRSNMQQVRKTDLTVYLRAAWAARTGEDLYAVTDEHGWHYHYPPLLATALVPFAQPPADSDAKPLVPFGTVVILWYCVGVFLASAAGPWLASKIGTLAVHREGRYRWWLVHAPLWMLLPALGSSLGRGQVNELILILLTGMVVSAVNGNRFGAGVWLAAATSIKVIPAFLILYPLWNRDTKWLAGTAVGLLFGLFILPCAVVGPRRTTELYQSWVGSIVHPAASGETDGDRGRELLSMTATDNQSFQGMFHNWFNLDRATRPKTASPVTRIAHVLAALLMTVVTLVAGKRSQMKNPQREALAITALFIPMLLASPVCHLHYFELLLPPIVAVVAAHLVNGQRVRPALAGGLIIVFATQLLPRIPGLEVARDIGVAAWGAMIVWVAAFIELSGEAKLKVKLPGARSGRSRWWGGKVVTIHEAGTRPTTIDVPRRRAS
ncbi:MAG: DUF2029 domain-containing protein [Gemmataceae bacterium]|nr:DUF2029 domain-containing protein [Gemmataceae bacterium]